MADCASTNGIVRAEVGADGLFRDEGKWWLLIDRHVWQLDKQAAEQAVTIYALKKIHELAVALKREAEIVHLPHLRKRCHGSRWNGCLIRRAAFCSGGQGRYPRPLEVWR